MTFNEWRQTRVWHDILPIDGVGTSGFMYDTEVWIELTNESDVIWHSTALAKYAKNLKALEYALWNKKVKFQYITQQDECTVSWSETHYYSCTAPLTRGLSNQEAFEEIQELITLDNDIDKEELSVSDPLIGEITWE